MLGNKRNCCCQHTGDCVESTNITSEVVTQNEVAAIEKKFAKRNKVISTKQSFNLWQLLVRNKMI
jgi:hypothetical protein